MPNTSDSPYFVDQFVGTGLPGESFTLSFSPARIDFVFFRKTAPTTADNPVHIAFDAAAAGTTKATTSGAGNRTLTIGSQVVVPTDFTLYVGYWYFGAGYDSSLTALRTSEQYDLQGDSESVTMKRKILTVETDTDSHFTTNVSGTTTTTTALRTDQENITNMPYNKFRIVGIKGVFGPQQYTSIGWPDFRLWFAKQDDFYASKNDPDLDDMWGFVDIASIMLCSLASTVAESLQKDITTYFFWPKRDADILDNKAHGGSFTDSAPFYYEDEDGTNELHIMLENKSTVAWEAGADRIKFWFQIEPVR